MAEWLLQTNLIQRSQYMPFVEAVIELSTLHTITVIPFSHVDLKQYENKSVIPYGSTKLVKSSVAENLKGVFYNENFNYISCLNYRNDMLNQDASIISIKQYLEQPIQGDGSDSIFVRPNEDLKLFPGTLIHRCRFASFIDTVNLNDDLDYDKLIVVAEPKVILAEYRLFIVNGNVVTASQYRRLGKLESVNMDSDMELEAMSVLVDDWLPHPTCVMDIALTDEGYKVIEFNCINCSGTYGHNVHALVRALTEEVDRHDGN